MTPGKVDPDIALDELIADWRRSGTTRPLPDWLGVPEDVYADWDEGRVQGHGWQPLRGTVWTVDACDGAALTATTKSGRSLTSPIPSGASVLRREVSR